MFTRGARLYIGLYTRQPSARLSARSIGPTSRADRSLVYTFTRDDRSARPIAATIAPCNHPVHSKLRGCVLLQRFFRPFWPNRIIAYFRLGLCLSPVTAGYWVSYWVRTPLVIIIDIFKSGLKSENYFNDRWKSK